GPVGEAGGDLEGEQRPNSFTDLVAQARGWGRGAWGPRDVERRDARPTRGAVWDAAAAVREREDHQDDRNRSGDRRRREATDQAEVEPAQPDPRPRDKFRDRGRRREVDDMGHARPGQLVEGLDGGSELRIRGGARRAR